MSRYAAFDPPELLNSKYERVYDMPLQCGGASARARARARSGAALPPAVYRSAWPDKAVATRVRQSAFAHECDGTVVGRRGGFLLGAALTGAPARESRADVST